MLQVNQIRLPLTAPQQQAVAQAYRVLHVQAADVETAGIAKISVDARRTPPSLVYSVALTLKDKGAEPALAGCAPCVSFSCPAPLTVSQGVKKMTHRPIVCGFGPAGIFAALLLAREGYRPIVLERGPSIEARTAAVEGFEAGGALRENANIQFGEGGAGTFSDGKLTTRIGSPLCGFVTQTLLEAGAPREIGWQQKPHIGTDVLRAVIVRLREEILRLGGEVRFETQLTGIRLQNGRVCAVQAGTEEIPCDTLLLATGHSARDTFAMLQSAGFSLRAKPFSVGFRAEHLQSRIEESLYHAAAGHPALPRGEYQLSQHVGARCVYTFCMCPGGSVVAAASEAGGVVTNGMSLHARDGSNANAAVVVSVGEADFDGDAMRAVAFQRELEAAAFRAGGGDYTAPAETMASFLQGAGTLKLGAVEPTYARGVRAANLGALLPQELADTLRTGLRSFEHKLRGYTASDVVLTGLETRTSSPVRMPRAENGESLDAAGVYPCGEGAGYAGGIMSAAVDGVRAAASIIEAFAPSAQ